MSTDRPNPKTMDPEDVWAVGGGVVVAIILLYAILRASVMYTELILVVVGIVLGCTVGLYALGYVATVAYSRAIAWRQRGEDT